MRENGTDPRIRLVPVVREESVEGRFLGVFSSRQRDMLVGALVAIAALGGVTKWLSAHIDEAVQPVSAQVAAVSAQVVQLAAKIDAHTDADAAVAQRVAKLEGAIDDPGPAYAGPPHHLTGQP